MFDQIFSLSNVENGSISVNFVSFVISEGFSNHCQNHCSNLTLAMLFVKLDKTVLDLIRHEPNHPLIMSKIPV